MVRGYSMETKIMASQGQNSASSTVCISCRLDITVKTFIVLKISWSMKPSEKTCLKNDTMTPSLQAWKGEAAAALGLL